MSDLAAFEYAARAFEKPRRRWPTPGAMAVDLDPKTRQSAALEIVDQELVKAADGQTPRLAIYFSPQEGKSERVSRRFPAWVLAADPTLRIGIVSYEYRKAERWGKFVRNDVIAYTKQLGVSLSPDSRAAGEWKTVQGGGIVCAGIGSALSGEPLDLLIIDDPVKGRAEAESIVYRDAAWDWWENVGERRLSSKLHPDGVVVLMTTRWHTDDLAGRLSVKQGQMWRVVSIPAIAESPNDPLGREPGEEMPSAVGRPPDHFHRLQQRLSGYVFRALYQQSPTSAQGNLFKRDDWRFWRHGTGLQLSLDGQVVDLRDCAKFITIDLATSMRTSADYTVAAAWAISVNGDVVLLDRVRDRVEEAGHFDMVEPLRQRWLGPYDVTYVESRVFGTTMVYAAGRKGLPLAELHADVDKLTRALPAADLVRQHRVWLPADAPWLDEWLDEHAEFPNAAHDDQVDVMAYAARVALAHWLPMETAAEVDARRAAKVDGLDFETMAF